MLQQICLLLVCAKATLAVDLTYTIEEGKSPRTLVGDIATDSQILRDIPLQQNLITYTQLKKAGMHSSQYFHVSKKTGKLYTNDILDAEAICERKKECFQIVDVAVQKTASTIKILEIKVLILDINDHNPEFPHKQISIQFDESDGKGMRRSIPHALDKDVGIKNSVINYQLKKMKNDPFKLLVSENVDKTSDLSIVLEEMLDREIKSSYMVQVIAKDGGSLQNKVF